MLITRCRILTRRSLGLLLALLLVGTLESAVEVHRIDSAHSAVGFSIRHLLIKLPGQFMKFNGAITLDRENLENSSVEATVEVASIKTGHDGRDKNLLKDDFFKAEAFPVITFKSKQWRQTGEGHFDVVGDLQMKGVTKEVVLKAQLLGLVPNPDGSVLSGWEVTGTINRNDFGVLGPQNLIANGTLGSEVGLNLAIEARYRPVEPAR